MIGVGPATSLFISSHLLIVANMWHIWVLTGLLVLQRVSPILICGSCRDYKKNGLGQAGQDISSIHLLHVAFYYFIFCICIFVLAVENIHKIWLPVTMLSEQFVFTNFFLLLIIVFETRADTFCIVMQIRSWGKCCFWHLISITK